MLGCGGEHDKDEVAAITASLTPMWRTLPKTNGRIDRRSLRYLVYRHFMQTSSLMVRGFEPTRLTNDSHWGAADILIMLDQLIFDSESAVLEGVYKEQKKSTKQSL